MLGTGRRGTQFIDDTEPMVSQTHISDFAKLLKFPPAWRVHYDGHFLSALPSRVYRVPPAGYKIRVNFNPFVPADAPIAIRIAAEVARHFAIPIKLLSTLSLCQRAARKDYPVEGAGKAITLYPGDSPSVFEPMCRELARRLSRTALAPAVHPVSDAALTNNVSIRWGAYTQQPTLTGPDGTLLSDYRDVFFLPPWVKLPPWIAETLAMEDAENEDFVVFDKYEVLACLHRTLVGAVYHGRDRLTQQNIIMKEARPYGETDGVLATTRLFHEADILRILQDDPELRTPEVLDVFEADGHTILVMTACMTRSEVAPPLFQWWQSRRAEKDNTPDILMQVARQVVSCLRRLHARHCAWMDFTPMNILVVETQPVGFALSLIDAEYAVVPATEQALFFDRRALGRLLLWLLSDDDSLLNPHREMQPADFDRLGSAPLAYQRAVHACFDPESDADALAELLQQ